MDKPQSLREALAYVTKRLSDIGIAKLRENKQQDFMFRGIDDIHNILSPVLVEAGLMVIPSYADRVNEIRKTSKGNDNHFVSIRGSYRIVFLGGMNPTGESIECGAFYGEATDMADKAANKAMSVAYKYFAVQTFCIPTEGQPDQEAAGEAPLTDHETTKLQELRDAALNGSKALQTAWEAAGKPMRLTLAGHLSDLKEAAALADKVPQ